MGDTGSKTEQLPPFSAAVPTLEQSAMAPFIHFDKLAWQTAILEEVQKQNPQEFISVWRTEEETVIVREA